MQKGGNVTFFIMFLYIFNHILASTKDIMYAFGVTLSYICEKIYQDSLNGSRAMSLSASQTEGGGGSGSGGSGSLCTNSMGNFIS